MDAFLVHEFCKFSLFTFCSVRSRSPHACRMRVFTVETSSPTTSTRRVPEASPSIAGSTVCGRVAARHFKTSFDWGFQLSISNSVNPRAHISRTLQVGGRLNKWPEEASEKYEPLEHLGSGSFGDVYKARRRSDSLLVIAQLKHVIELTKLVRRRSDRRSWGGIFTVFLMD